jgi:catechol 2,3-dioxygenase-like lactoylglutathione lyase family enzyme
MEQPSYPHLSNTVLGTPDPQALARFYVELLDWRYRDEDHSDPTWVVIKPPDGGTGLSFQLETEHEPPTWPTERGTQQMQLHLDIGVDDLDRWVGRAEELGARQAEWQPQPLVRVMHDPDGHVFCLFAPGG